MLKPFVVEILRNLRIGGNEPDEILLNRIQLDDVIFTFSKMLFLNSASNLMTFAEHAHLLVFKFTRSHIQFVD